MMIILLYFYVICLNISFVLGLSQNFKLSKANLKQIQSKLHLSFKSGCVAAMPTIPNQTVCVVILIVTLQSALTRSFSPFTFSEVIFLSFKPSRSSATISIVKDSSRDIIKAQSL